MNLLLCRRRMFGLFTHCVFSSSGSTTPCSGAVTMDFLSLWSRRHLCTNRSSASAREECKQDRQQGAGTDERTFQSKPPKTKLFSNRNDTFLLSPTVLGPSGSITGSRGANRKKSTRLEVENVKKSFIIYSNMTVGFTPRMSRFNNSACFHLRGANSIKSRPSTRLSVVGYDAPPPFHITK